VWVWAVRPRLEPLLLHQGWAGGGGHLHEPRRDLNALPRHHAGRDADEGGGQAARRDPRGHRREVPQVRDPDAHAAVVSSAPWTSRRSWWRFSGRPVSAVSSATPGPTLVDVAIDRGFK